MQRPAYFEQQHLWRYDTDFRSEVARPAGKSKQGLLLALDLTLFDVQGGQESPRFSQPPAGNNASRGGLRIGDDDSFLADDRARRRQSGKNFEWQAPQMKG